MDVTSMRVVKIEIDGRVVDISDSVKERLSRAIYAACNFANAMLDIPSLFFIIIVRNTNKPRTVHNIHRD